MGERFILIMAIVGVLAAWQFAERGCQIRSGGEAYSRSGGEIDANGRVHWRPQ